MEFSGLADSIGIYPQSLAVAMKMFAFTGANCVGRVNFF